MPNGNGTSYLHIPNANGNGTSVVQAYELLHSEVKVVQHSELCNILYLIFTKLRAVNPTNFIQMPTVAVKNHC